jgi:hypothetical protein
MRFLLLLSTILLSKHRVEFVEAGGLDALRDELVQPEEPDSQSKAANCIGSLSCVPCIASWIATSSGPAQSCGAITPTLLRIIQECGDNVYLLGDACFAIGWLTAYLPTTDAIALFDATTRVIQAFIRFHSRPKIPSKTPETSEPATGGVSAETTSPLDSASKFEAVSNTLAYIAILLLKICELLLQAFPAHHQEPKKHRRRPSRKARESKAKNTQPEPAQHPALSEAFLSGAQRTITRLFNCEFLEHLLQYCCELVQNDDLTLLNVALQVLTAVCCFKEGRLSVMHCAALSKFIELRTTLRHDELRLLQGVLDDLKREALAAIAKPARQ